MDPEPDLDGLLPSAAAVRCVLAQEVELRLYALYTLMNRRVDTDLMRSVASYRDDQFLAKLRAVVPAEDLRRCTREGRLDLADLIASRPYVETMYVMETATIVNGIQRRIQEGSPAQGSGE